MTAAAPGPSRARSGPAGSNRPIAPPRPPHRGAGPSRPIPALPCPALRPAPPPALTRTPPAATRAPPSWRQRAGGREGRARAAAPEMPRRISGPAGPRRGRPGVLPAARGPPGALPPAPIPPPEQCRGAQCGVILKHLGAGVYYIK